MYIRIVVETFDVKIQCYVVLLYFTKNCLFLRLENEKLKIQKEREEFTRLNAKKSDNEKVNAYCLASLFGWIHHSWIYVPQYYNNTIDNHPCCAPLC